MSRTPYPNALMQQVLTAATEILCSATAEPSVERFVYTFSITTCVVPVPKMEFKVDESYWIESCSKETWALPPYAPARSAVVYPVLKIGMILTIVFIERTH